MLRGIFTLPRYDFSQPRRPARRQRSNPHFLLPLPSVAGAFSAFWRADSWRYSDSMIPRRSRRGKDLNTRSSSDSSSSAAPDVLDAVVWPWPPIITDDPAWASMRNGAGIFSMQSPPIGKGRTRKRSPNGGNGANSSLNSTASIFFNPLLVRPRFHRNATWQNSSGAYPSCGRSAASRTPFLSVAPLIWKPRRCWYCCFRLRLLSHWRL